MKKLKKNFTNNNTKDLAKSFFVYISSVLKVTLTLVMLLSFSIFNKTFAAVAIYPATATVYACPSFPTAYFNLGTIGIKEGANADFPSNSTGTITLTAPANFEFEAGFGSAYFLPGRNMTAASITVTSTTITLSWTTTTGGGAIDSIALNGIRIRGTNDFSGGTVLKTGETGASVAGSGLAPYANLSSVIFPSTSAGSDQLVCATTSTMDARALANNITGVWTVISGTGTFGNSGSPTSTVSGLSVGVNKFRWTISAPGGCTAYAEMVISRETSGFACDNKNNEFSAVTNISVGTGTCTVAGTKTVFTLADAGPFIPGNKVLIIQMQGALVNTTTVEPPTAAVDATFGSITGYNGAGKYEFAVIDTKTGNDVTFVQNPINTYVAPAGKVQLVTVPQYASHTIPSLLQGTAWNGTTGGVLVFDVIGTLTLNANINMNGRGFAGGARSNFGASCNGPTALYTRTTSATGSSFRGYGIHDFGAEIYGRGAYANAGGGGAGHNAGGGGGSNICAGGRGGWEYGGCSGYATNLRQGRPGYALASSSSRIFMGGGGGGGNGDGGGGSAGGAGGGIIIISAGEIAGTSAVISSNGIAGENNGTAQTPVSYADGSGGGGGGGTVLLNVGLYSIGSLIVRANGGKGGNNGQQSTCHGPGGGGGGGLVWTSEAAVPGNVTRSAAGGVAGIGSPQAEADACHYPYGAEPGGSCSALNNLRLNAALCCSQANLGPDMPLCGAGTITLNNGTLGANTNKVFTWYKNGVIVAGPCSCPTYDATTVGTYTVRVDSIVDGYTFCSSQDNMNITSNMPIPYLGPDQILCNPSYLNLTAYNFESFPTGTTWSWMKDGVVISGETTPYLNNVTAAGTYTVIATAAGCAPTTDDIIITLAIPTTTGNCIPSPGTITLSASGGNGGPYKWYTSSTGGSSIFTGSTYTPTISTTTTYWVEDEGNVTATHGVSPSAPYNSQNAPGNTSTSHKQLFEVFTAFDLIGITVIPSSTNASTTVSINIRSSDASGTVGAIVATRSVTGVSTTTGVPYNFDFSASPISLSPGYYLIEPNAGVSIYFRAYSSNIHPTTYSDDVLGPMFRSVKTLDGGGAPENVTRTSFFNWIISYPKPCSRVPVIAEVGGSCAVSTPVSLINFSGENRQDNVLLEWSTASEFNNDHFLVQRSIDGVSFETIGKVSGNGTSYNLHQYSFIDNKLVSGILYYRLVQVDYDGTETKCKVISVNNDRSASISLFPNPFNEGINLVVGSHLVYKVKIKLSDLAGKVLYSSEEYSSNETITLGEGLPEGTYLVEIRTDYETKTARVVKMK